MFKQEFISKLKWHVSTTVVTTEVSTDDTAEEVTTINFNFHQDNSNKRNNCDEIYATPGFSSFRF